MISPKNIAQKSIARIVEQLKQGATPNKIAQSIAFGVVLGSCPILGLTTPLCLLVAFSFRLNHIVIQAVNYLVYPLQLAMVIPFIALGERIYSKPATSLSILTMTEQFKINYKLAFEKYFILGAMGSCAWLITSPIVFVIIYYISKLVLVRTINQNIFTSSKEFLVSEKNIGG